jgi:hypothetical protein
MADSATHGASWPTFIHHFLEMVAAMVVAMMVLGAMVRMALTQLGHSALLDQTELAALVMATNMTAGMTLLMRYRRHSWASVAEMAGAMYLPFLVLLIPFWAGLLSGAAVMAGGHILMVPCMIVVMLHRRREFAQQPHGHDGGGRRELAQASTSGQPH